MEHNALVTVSEIQNGAFEDLPYDVHREVFRYIPTRNLISVWRLVSTKWSRYASALCHQRSVILRLPRHDEIFDVPIGHLFLDVDHLPVSKVHLALGCDRLEWYVFSNYVARHFGTYVNSARISARLPNYGPFFETLRNTPNLVSLELFPRSAYFGQENMAEDYTFRYEEIELPELKSLKMVYEPRGHFLQLLEIFFQQLSPQLDSVDLTLYTDDRFMVEDAELNRCAELLSSRNFPKLSLGLPLEAHHSNGWKTLVGRGRFDIHTLTVSSHGEDTERLDMTSDLLGPFLANCSGLTSLTLSGFEKRSLTSTQCRVPVMPTVTKLELTVGFSENAEPMSQFQFEPFTAQRFPSLNEVVVHCRRYGVYGGERAKVDVRQLFCVTGDRFLGVTSLDVGATQSTTNWADTFPNVQKMSAVISRHTETLSPIFENMTQVTEVDLEIKDRIFDLVQFLDALEKLKHLTLRFTKLGDDVATFLALSPMNLKIIYSERKVSDRCISLLSVHHLSVELKEDKKKNRLTDDVFL